MENRDSHMSTEAGPAWSTPLIKNLDGMIRVLRSGFLFGGATQAHKTRDLARCAKAD
jgi:hypothetical protein